MEIQFLSKVECQEKFDIEISYKTKFFTDWDKTGDGGPVLITLEMIYRDENGKKCKRYIGTYYPYIGFTKHSENKHELIIIDAVGNGDFSDEFKTGVTAFIKESNYKSFNGSSYEYSSEYDYIPDDNSKLFHHDSEFFRKMSYKKENRNHQFEFIKIPLKEMKFIDLSDAKAIIDQLNKQWNCKNYYIGLDYWFDLKENSKIVNYCWIDHDRNNLILGIFTTENNNCVSSIEIQFNPYYCDDEGGICIGLEPYCLTHPDYRRRKMNVLLYSVLIQIGQLINKDINTLIISGVEATHKLLGKYFKYENTEVSLNMFNAGKAVFLFNEIVNTLFHCDNVPVMNDIIIASGGKRNKYKIKLSSNTKRKINKKTHILKCYKTKKRGKTLYKRSKISKNY